MSELERYKSERAALIQQDRSLRSDHSHSSPLSTAEANADRVIRDLRASEASSIWAADYGDEIPHPFPGMEFLTGALLHAHLDATVNAEVLLKLALEQPAMHVRISNAVNASNVSKTLPEFSPLTPELFSDTSSLTDASYSPNTWVPILKARESFAFGGPEAFDKWVIGALTINPSEAYKTHNTVNKIWEKFTSTFLVSGGLIRFVPVYTRYIKEFFLTSIEDGISYIEVRINFLFKNMFGADGQENVPHREWLIIFEKVLNEVKAEMKQQGREGEFLGAKIIYSTIRFISPEELEWYLHDCIALKKEFPHLIAGFDLVGPENVLKPLIFYAEPLLKFKDMQKVAGVDIPFIFHAGETLGDGTEADVNLYDAILLGTKRIGHGFSLVKHPKLMQICRERGIAVEVCPISNEILRLTSSMLTHPLPVLLNNGIPVALCSDDPAVFGNMGLTFDFFQAFVASEVNGLITLRETARDSLKYSMLSPEEKERAIALWEKRWEKFVEHVVEVGAEFAAV